MLGFCSETECFLFIFLWVYPERSFLYGCLKIKGISGNLAYQSIIDIWNGEVVHNWLTPPSRSCFSTNVPCATCRDDFYNRCHAIYSRCLRFCYETFFDTNTCDINCPNVSFQEYRIT